MKKIISLFICLLMVISVIGCTFINGTKPVEEPNEEINQRYEIYKLASESGFTGTYEEWLASIKGDEVELKTSNGMLLWKYKEEAEHEWKVLYDLTQLKGEKGDKGDNGKSAYELAVSAGFTGTEEEWVASLDGGIGLPGPQGEDGKSAYDLAKELGYTGTLEEWIASLKGEQGLQGPKGEQGAQGPKGDKGNQGEQGVSVESIEKIKTEDNIDTYRITLSNGNTFDFEVVNAIKHNYQFAYTLIEATEDKEGIDVYYCTDCDEVIMRKVPKQLYIRQENKIYFGKYPQTLVTDNSLIEELNTRAGTLPTSANTYSWTDYNYYISSNITSYMFYQDIDKDNDGSYDYRGVYFTQYRPYIYSYSSSNANYTYQDENRYSINTVYWFSYDPIEWDILEETNGKALIIANLILDSQEYYPSNSESQFYHNGGTGYANNYELSNIRKFLNETFYDTAFNDLQKSFIETTLVDNSGESTGDSSNPYICNNTNDKLFLLSRQEVITYYLTGSSITAQGTDYAKAQGLYGNSSNGNRAWWLRSPDYYDANFAHRVYNGCYIDSYHVYFTYNGVRPACYINLQ